MVTPPDVVRDVTSSSASVRAGVGEQPRALADHDGIRQQVELVDQVVGEQPPDEGTAARHHQLAVVLRLQLTDGRGKVAGQDVRALPLGIGEAVRGHVPGFGVQRDGDRVVALDVAPDAPVPPGGGENLVGPSAEEKRVRAAVNLADVFLGFRVEERKGPSAAVEAATAVLVRSAQALHHAVNRNVCRRRQPRCRGPLPDLSRATDPAPAAC